MTIEIRPGDKVAFKHKGTILHGSVRKPQRRTVGVLLDFARSNERQSMMNVPRRAILAVNGQGVA